MIKKIVTLISAIVLAAAAGCSSKSVTQVKSEPAEKKVQSAVTQLKITPATAKLTEGGTIQFSVTGADAKAKSVAVTANWNLKGSKTVIGTLDTVKGEKVIFTAKVPGKVTLEAEYNNVKATAAIEITRKKGKK